MSEIRSSTVNVDGIATHIMTGGSKSGRPMVLLHGATPGVTPYAGGTHVWAGVLEAFASTNPVLAIDLLGSGGTDFIDRVALIDDYGAHVLAVLKDQNIQDAHIIGHDLGGAVALWLAMKGESRASSISVVASAEVTPLIDSLENLTFLNPPGIPFGCEAQRWAYQRMSYTPHHVDDALIRASLKATASDGPRKAQAIMADPSALPRLTASIGRFRGQMWAAARAGKFPVPAQFIWAANDPITPRDRGFKLFETIGLGQPLCAFHLVPRSGSFVFREHPAEFQDLIMGYVEGLAETPALFKYS